MQQKRWTIFLKQNMRHPIIVLFSGTFLAMTSIGLITGEALAGEVENSNAAAIPRVTIPLADPQRGKDAFVNKGCVLCHSINEVGGKAAPSLDQEVTGDIEVLAFAARLWRGASAMLELQAVELGYQIELSEQEMADLAAFLSDAEVQKSFTKNDVPEPMSDWMIMEPYWEEGEWPEYFKEENPQWEKFFNPEEGDKL